MFKASTSHSHPNWSGNQGRPAPKPPRNAIRLRCSHCQKLGHKKHQCYELVNYPSNWGEPQNNRGKEGQGQGGVKLWGIGQLSREEGGGTARGVRHRAGQGARNNRGAFLAADWAGESREEKSNSQITCGGLTTAQLEELFAFYKAKDS